MAADVVEEATNVSFGGLTASENVFVNGVKTTGINIVGPLLINDVSLDSYLLDKTDVRIRVEFAPPPWVLLVNDAASNLQYNIKRA